MQHLKFTDTFIMSDTSLLHKESSSRPHFELDACVFGLDLEAS